MVSLSIVGNTHYIIDEDENTAISFNNFGEKISEMSMVTALRLCNGFKTKVGIISILGEACKSYCEIYADGYVAEVKEEYIDVFTKVSKCVHKASYGGYRVNHENRVTQILIPTDIYYDTKEEIGKAIPGLQWVKLNSN